MDLIKIHELPEGTIIEDGHELPVSTGSNSGDVKRFSMALLKAWIIGFVTPLFAGITQGPAGPSGTPGSQGIQGQKGDKGDRGDKGDQGLKGDIGPAGAIGIQGAKGDKGEKGDKGNQGTQGIQGPQGLQGERGENGEDGAIIVAGEATNLLSGTVDPTSEGIDGDFYINTTTDILFGPKDSGLWPSVGVILTGPAGPVGPAGAVGAQGVQGVQGIQGIKGDTGEKGDKGDKGDTGPAGPVGAAGPTGAKGDPGDTGGVGPAGAAGAAGAAGPAGAKGDKGDNGAGVPVGGNALQILAKIDSTNFNTQWIDLAGAVANYYPDGTIGAKIGQPSVNEYVRMIGSNGGGITRLSFVNGTHNLDFRYQPLGLGDGRMYVQGTSISGIEAIAYLSDIGVYAVLTAGNIFHGTQEIQGGDLKVSNTGSALARITLYDGAKTMQLRWQTNSFGTTRPVIYSDDDPTFKAVMLSGDALKEVTTAMAVSNSSDNTVTKKIKLTIGATDYYLLATTSNA
ncbi:hypothetical protein [Mucilaginibacter sp.]|uniref:hypothetical protein n=1 Tax=Mucilaginibacter sp. TaxID=1882438 RepID=UPI000CC1B58C|nr:hypothetical protein [Mucilaginibacter sp.]PLW89980.1 MAG: hypothetical protein C0154_08635 [Mucilaginibacter sp.]PMP65774.1 MAG: hypothetical protein C0191_02625 [Mucilaginibacter sp.]